MGEALSSDLLRMDHTMNVQACCPSTVCSLAHAQVKKKLALSELPLVLVLTLKRYSMGMYGKISRPVSFGEELDLSDFYEPSNGAPERETEAERGEASSGGPESRWARYRLCGVVVHHDVMNSCFYGHYVAYVRSGEEWKLMDDDDMTECR